MDDEHTGFEEEAGTARRYLEAIKESQASFSNYTDTCDRVDRLYSDLESLAAISLDREFQIFWANMEVVRPIIYSRPPVPVVQERHKVRNPVLRAASEIMERKLSVDIETDDLHETLRMVRDDLALNSRGVPWVLDDGACIHVEREDFCHEPARKWLEVGWVARRAHMSAAEIKKRFPTADLDKLKFEHPDTEYKGDKKAPVWEVWDKTTTKVAWVSDDYDKFLDTSEPLVDVDGWFPCPRPAYGTLQRRSLIPVPDVIYYADQIEEINELTARISGLAESLRMKGFYPGGSSEIGQAVENAMVQTDDKALLVPVSNFAAFGGGAMKDAIVWLPIADVVVAIRESVSLRKQLIEDVYEITGISDIIRGASEASETATAQQIKTQYAAVRIRERQAEMIRVALDVLRIKGEIFAERIPADQLVRETMVRDVVPADQIPMLQMQAQQAGEDVELVPVEAVDALLKSDRMRSFAMEIETDSTIQPDEEREKRSRVEFTQAMGALIEQAGPLVMQFPPLGGLVAETIKFTASGFRAGRPLGSVIDQFAEDLKAFSAEAERARAEARGQEPPEAAAKKAELQLKGQELDLKRADLAMRAEGAKFSVQGQAADQAMKRAETEMKIHDSQRENERRDTKLQFDIARSAQEMGLKVDESKMKKMQAEIDAILRIDEVQMEHAQQRPVKFGND